jgi:small subunit ribosomal protein S1
LELSWKRVAHPREVVEAGQELDVYVLRVDRERQRVALSLKRLQPDPWLSVEDRYQEGQLVEGVVTRLTKWGAFASVVGDEAIEGLIHISELTNNPVVHPREIIKPDQVVTLRIIGLDAENHRLSLSLKRVDEEEFRGEDWKTTLTADHPEPQSSLSAALSDVIASSGEGLPNTN